MFTVNTLADGQPDWTDGFYTLREAILDANSTGTGPRTINFAANVQGTIALTGQLPAIVRDVDIVGPGKGNLTVARPLDATSDFRIMYTTQNAAVTVSGITISGGQLLGGFAVTQAGAGIYVDSGSLTLTNCAVKNNKSGYEGGGIYVSAGGVRLNNTEVSGNRADWNGGGLYLREGVSEVLNGSVVRVNISQGYGGGIFVEGSLTGGTNKLTISDSDVNENESRYEGGGIYLEGSSTGSTVRVNATNSHFDYNRARERGGGAVYADSPFTATDCYFDGNTGMASPGYVIASGGSAELQTAVTLTNCTVRNNHSTPDPNAPGYEGAAVGAAPGRSVGLTACTITGNDGNGVAGDVVSGGNNVAENSLNSSFGWVGSDYVT